MANKPKEKMVKVRLPIIKGAESQERYVALNGRRFKIKRGTWVEVPEGIAEIIRHSEEQEYIAEELKEALEDIEDNN